MSWLNRIRSATSRLASNALSGAWRLASNIIPESVQRRITDFGSWLTDRVGPYQTPQVLNEIVEHVRTNYPPRQPFEVRESNSALREFARVYTINGIDGIDARSFLDNVRENITRVLRENRGIKVKLILHCYMERPINLGETIIRPAPFQSYIHINLDGTDEDDIYIIMTERILEVMATFQSMGSGWRLYSIDKLELHTVRYNPARGETWLPLPKELANKKAIINMKNTDNKCFLWCVLRALNLCEKDPQRIDKKLKEKENTLNMEGIEYPVTLKDINKFENQNPTICITVFGYNGKNVYPLKNSDNTDRKHKIVLMLIEKDGVKHYCLVKNVNRLLSSQVSNHKEKHHFCLRCLNAWTHKSLNKHLEYCSNHEAVKIEMPEKGDILKFKNYHRGEKVPFIIYADFESLIKSIQSSNPNPESSYTNKYQKHEPISFSYYIKCFDDNVFKPRLRSYTEEDAAQKFIEWLEEDIKYIVDIRSIPLIMEVEEKERFNKETKCWICKGEFNNDKDYKVRDHCHFTGRYRGAAHNSCNLKYRKPNFTPVVFHNLSNYDSHLFIKNLGFSEGNIDCIPNNEEKYISFSKSIHVGSYTNKEGETKPLKHTITFIDSFKFMAASLDSLVNNLPEDAFNNVKRYYCGEKLNLVTRKGIYPYEYMDSLERLKENKLPPKESFYSRLNDEDISDEDYQHAPKVWEVFDMEHLQEYHNLYNETDVILLADVFENFRSICIKNYELHPAHYYTAPGLAWDATLKITGVELELLTNIDMLLMIEKGIRGGVSVISNRYGKANNKYMGDKFVASEISKYIDANNLYGWAMSKPLPTHGFKWMKDSELEKWEKYSCILEVDLEYPKNLHDLHNDYPLAPEQIEVNKVDKLIPNLGYKEKYIIHYENFKQYLSLGLKLVKIHRGIKFEESPWLKKYIDLNTNLRTKAKNEFEKDFFKLMNNSVFGKTMENIRIG